MYRILVVTISLALLSSLLQAGEKYEYDILMMGMPAGTATEEWTRKEHSGTCTITLASSSEISLARGGTAAVTMKSSSILVADCGTLLPVSLNAELDEGGSKLTFSAKRNGTVLETVIEKNGVKETNSLPLQQNAVFFSMMFRKYPASFFTGSGRVNVISEESLTYQSLDFTGTLIGDIVDVKMNYGGVPVVFQVKNKVVLRSILQGGLLSYQLRGATPPPPSSPAAAPDIMTKTAIPNNGVPIPRPDKTSETSFTVTPVSSPAPTIPQTCYQKVTGSEKQITVTVKNKVSACPGTSQMKKDGLAPTIYEDKDNQEIRRAAAQWAGLTPKQKIAKAVSFVYHHITNKTYAFGNLSASEAYAKKSGDCSEHATLLSALLKAAGIPCRMAYGITLDNQGLFRFHNWNEAFDGTNWVPVDATFNQYPADASRILLVYGGPSSSDREQVNFAILKFMSGIDIRATGYRYE